MGQEEARLLDQAVELTKAALESPTGNLACIAHPEDAAKFLETIHEKLVELSKDSQ